MIQLLVQQAYTTGQPPCGEQIRHSKFSAVAWQAVNSRPTKYSVQQCQHLSRKGLCAVRPHVRQCQRLTLTLRAEAPQATAATPGDVSAVVLAGGVGKRMGAPIPKQYLELRGQAIAAYSIEIFAAMPEVGEIVVVCEPEYREVFEAAHRKAGPGAPPLRFALPGKERQDSVFNGLQVVQEGAALVAIHDSARPLMDPADVRKCLKDAREVGAAVLGVPVKPTIKEVNKDGTVVKTLERAKLWEVQTPQVIRPSLLRDGFALVKQKSLEVTDDVSIIEAMGLPVKVTLGSYTNIKVTTPDDMAIAERLLAEQEAARRQVTAAQHPVAA